MRIFFLLLAMVLVASFPFLSDYFSGKSHKSVQEIEKLIEEYILRNPKTIIDSIQNLGKNEERDAKENFFKLFDANKEEILDFSYPNFKSSNAKAITIIEFFDYSCGYCKRVKPFMDSLIKDQKVNVIFREMPILGEQSHLASKFAIAVYMVNAAKYVDFHTQLLLSNTPYTKESLTDVLHKVFVDAAKVSEVLKVLEVDDQKIENKIKGTYSLANKLGIRGTPAFIVGNKLHVGSLSENELNSLIDEVNKKK